MTTPKTPSEALNQFKVLIAEMEDDGLDIAKFVKEECELCPICGNRFAPDMGVGQGAESCCSIECHYEWMRSLEQCYGCEFDRPTEFYFSGKI